MRHIIYFTAEWCNPCKRTKPFAEELKQEGYPIQFVDADSELDMVKNFSIKSVPTFIVMDDNVEISRTNGAKTKLELLHLLEG